MKNSKIKYENKKIIDKPLLISPIVFLDERGFFYESYNKSNFNKLTGDNISFYQDNHSKSTYGVLRGLHYQLPPYGQGKLVRCSSGSIFDVAVDLRRKSPTFKKWFGYELNETNKNQLWIPEGFAHGFLTLSKIAEVQYKTTNYWNNDSERVLKWDDSDIGIEWPIYHFKEGPFLSAKDTNAMSFRILEEKDNIF